MDDTDIINDVNTRNSHSFPKKGPIYTSIFPSLDFLELNNGFEDKFQNFEYVISTYDTTVLFLTGGTIPLELLPSSDDGTGEVFHTNLRPDLVTFSETILQTIFTKRTSLFSLL